MTNHPTLRMVCSSWLERGLDQKDNDGGFLCKIALVLLEWCLLELNCKMLMNSVLSAGATMSLMLQADKLSVSLLGMRAAESLHMSNANT